jgi:hypothetical protein
LLLLLLLLLQTYPDEAHKPEMVVALNSFAGFAGEQLHCRLVLCAAFCYVLYTRSAGTARYCDEETATDV